MRYSDQQWGSVSFIVPFVVFFPLFPSLFGASQVHINFIVLALLLLPLIFYANLNELRGLKLLVVNYYAICQVLLIPSLVIDILSNQVSNGSLFSFLRPFFMCIAYLALLELVNKANIKRLMLVIKLVILLSVVYAVFELFFLEYFSDIIFGLYKREERINLRFSVITFFGTTYYAAFAYFTMALLMLGNFEQTRKKGNLLFVGLASFLVFLTQSKAGIAALVVALSLMMFLSYTRLLRSLFLLALFAFLLIALNIGLVFELLGEYNLVAVKQTYELIFDTGNSETLGSRLSQIYYAIDIVDSNFGIFGGGLVPTEGSLESWIALFLYRYGLLGVFNFIFLTICIAYLSLKPVYHVETINYLGFAKAGFAWGITLPITQLSTPMMELGKTAFIANFFLAIITISLRNKTIERSY